MVVVGGAVEVVVVRDVVVVEADRRGEGVHAASEKAITTATSAGTNGRRERGRLTACRSPSRPPAPRTPFIAARGRGPIVAWGPVLMVAAAPPAGPPA